MYKWSSDSIFNTEYYKNKQNRSVDVLDDHELLKRVRDNIKQNRQSTIVNVLSGSTKKKTNQTYWISTENTIWSTEDRADMHMKKKNEEVIIWSGLCF